MLHVKFVDHRNSGSVEIFKGFYHIRVWWPSWSCDLHHHSPFQRRLHINLALIGKPVSEEKMFEHCGRRLLENGYTIS